MNIFFITIYLIYINSLKCKMFINDQINFTLNRYENPLPGKTRKFLSSWALHLRRQEEKSLLSEPAANTGKVFFLVRSTATKLSLVGSLMAYQPNASSAWAAAHVAHKLSISSRLFVSACPSLLGSRYIILVVSGEPDPAGLPPLGPVTRQSLKLRRSHATLLHGHVKMIFV